MSKVKKEKLNPIWIVLIIILLLIDFGLLIKYLTFDKNIALFNPQGMIAQEQNSLMMFVVLVLLAIAIPSVFIAYFTAWKYRESNTKISTKPHKTTSQSKYLVYGMWLIPIIVMIIVTSVMIPATHRLVPQKVIASDNEPITIQVISLNWKWLFLYPEQNIASVNFVQIPVNTPVNFELTADESPMSSFWIPNLGGQLYSMTSHVNRLNLIADTPGDYPGKSAEINGIGFAGMKFIARASSEGDFNQWVQTVKLSSNVLDNSTYDGLVEPSEYNPVELYSAYESDIFDNVLLKYNEFDEGHSGH